MADDPKPPPTKVAARAKLKIDAKPVDVVSTFGDGFTLFLTKPAKLGTPISFCQWAEKSFNAEIPLVKGFELPKDAQEHKTAVMTRLESLGIPEGLRKTLAELLLVQITLDALVVDTKNRAFMFGITLNFKAERETGWELLPNCELEEFQLLISRAAEDYEWPKPPQLPDVPALEEETDEVDLEADTLDEEIDGEGEETTDEEDEEEEETIDEGEEVKLKD
jgi:hypothetical protein